MGIAVRALAESNDVQAARAAMRRYLKGDEFTLIPDATHTSREPSSCPWPSYPTNTNALRGRALSTCSCAGRI